MDSLLKQFRQSSQLGANAAFIDDLYESWLVDPSSVDAQWNSYFETLKGREAGDIPHTAVIAEVAKAAKDAAAAPTVGGGSKSAAAAGENTAQFNVGRLIQSYRARGHLFANIDPLGLLKPHESQDLTLAAHNLSESDLDTEFATGGIGGRDSMKLRDLIEWLNRTYTGSIGAEIMHIDDTEQRKWLIERMESAGGDARYSRNSDQKKRILDRLIAADGLERYLGTKYVGQKRFSLEGGDSLIPMMDNLISRSGEKGIKEIVIGMAHRGRLNVLVNTLGKPPRQLFDEFEGKFEHDPLASAGDVKYHMGFSADIATPGGPVHLALAFNPSHLEIVAPVVAGSVRSRQDRRLEAGASKVLGIVIHGDAAFAGQGVNMELFQMSQARGFKVGGIVHIVINNQIGFTTSYTEDARSTPYSTDVSRMVNAPVFHVNGDDPEAVLFATEIALDYREKFGRDVVLDLFCYRRNGHNEADEPAATQPVMYRVIRAHKRPAELFANKLIEQGELTADAFRAMTESYRGKLDAGELTTEVVDAEPDEFDVDWKSLVKGKISDPVDTTVPMDKLTELATVINAVPDDLKLHPRVAKIYEDRRKMTAGELPGDWGFAENLAYATLVQAGNRLRLVGQDCGRGTFFHRHAILHEQTNDEYVLPLRRLVTEPNNVTIIDSLLSEEAVMAFEYGYSTTDPNTLDIWEGQFGDFANGAQVVIDQFLSSGEAKWGRISGLALFLPHGYEGQGPEHSSARLERYLQLCALNNMIVCTPTTPAQAFHMIRRQMLMTTRKPLVVMTPKSLLRHKLAVSSLDDMANGKFYKVIPDSLIADNAAARKKVKRVVVCGGKVYYDLVEAAERDGIKDIAIVRVEQLYPFPRQELTAELAKYPSAKEVIWCQEEPMNQGAWYQIRHHLHAVAGKLTLGYAGRARSASPAVGHLSDHVKEQEALLAAALAGEANEIDID